MIYILIKLLIINIVFSINLFSSSDIVKICDDKEEWPPFSYFQRKNGIINKNKLDGITTDLVKEIFKISNLNYKIDMIPWKRCLKYVDYYDISRKYELVLNASYSKQREEKYYLSKPLYNTHYQLFYSKNKFNKNNILKKVHSMKNLKVCDASGYQIKHYYINFKLSKDIKINTNSKSYISVLKKIDKQRCDITIFPSETIYGGEIIGKYKIPNSIENIELPSYSRTPFYILVAKKSPRAKILLKKINFALDTLHKNGTYDKIIAKYLHN